MISAPATAAPSGCAASAVNQAGGSSGRAAGGGMGGESVPQRGRRRPSDGPGHACRRGLVRPRHRRDTALAHARATDRHGHVPVHRHRGLDPAAPADSGERWPALLERHHACCCARPSRRTVGSRSGRRATRFFVAFPTRRGRRRAPRSPRSARSPTSRGGTTGRVRVRMGLHTGEADARRRRRTWGSTSTAPRASRRPAHGGQVLLSDAARALVSQDARPRASRCATSASTA